MTLSAALSRLCIADLFFNNNKAQTLNSSKLKRGKCCNLVIVITARENCSKELRIYFFYIERHGLLLISHHFIYFFLFSTTASTISLCPSIYCIFCIKFTIFVLLACSWFSRVCGAGEQSAAQQARQKTRSQERQVRHEGQAGSVKQLLLTHKGC